MTKEQLSDFVGISLVVQRRHQICVDKVYNYYSLPLFPAPTAESAALKSLHTLKCCLHTPARNPGYGLRAASRPFPGLFPSPPAPPVYTNMLVDELAMLVVVTAS